MATRPNCAYLAGYVDAEGCIYVVEAKASSRIWSARVSFNQNNDAVISAIQALYGGSKSTSADGSFGYSLQHMEGVRRFLREVLPYLGEKRDQAQALLDRFDSCDHVACAQLSADLKRMKHISYIDREMKLPQRLARAPNDPNRKCARCDRKAHARGLCQKHYDKARRSGEFIPRKRRSGVPFQYGKTPTIADLSYFAGFFDGDGSVGISPADYSWSVGVTFNQTQPHVVLRMHEIYGGSLIHGASPEKATHKPKLHYQLKQREAVLAFLRDIRPYVIEKCADVDLVLTRYNPYMTSAEARELQASFSYREREDNEETGSENE